MSTWSYEGERADGKEIFIAGPEMWIAIDNDDVPSDYVAKMVPLILEALNRHLPAEVCQKVWDEVAATWDDDDEEYRDGPEGDEDV